jgi:hypothetical protein
LERGENYIVLEGTFKAETNLANEAIKVSLRWIPLKYAISFDRKPWFKKGTPTQYDWVVNAVSLLVGSRLFVFLFCFACC